MKDAKKDGSNREHVIREEIYLSGQKFTKSELEPQNFKLLVRYHYADNIAPTS